MNKDEKHPPGLIVEKGTFVKIRYCLKTREGETIKGDPEEGLAYMDFYTGYDQVFPVLEKRLVGKKADEKMVVCLSPEEAFGPYREDWIKEKSYEEFPEGRQLMAGKWAMARDEKTRTTYGYFVKSKDADRIVLDYNHPFAGKELIYDLEIVEARPATEEEKELLRPCETGTPEL